MFQVGDRVRVTDQGSWYFDEEATISRVIVRNNPVYKSDQKVDGFALRGLGFNETSQVSTFWSDQLEAI